MTEMPRRSNGEPNISQMVRDILFPLPPREAGWEEVLRNRTREKIREWSCPSAVVQSLQQKVDAARKGCMGILSNAILTEPFVVIADALLDAYVESSRQKPSSLPDTDPDINLDAEQSNDADFETNNGGSA